MQTQKTLQQMIREYELNMPPEIMDLIKSFDWRKEVRMIVNQNQLMLDIGADLEESVYLMILGVIDIEEVFNRLIEVHELPQDKVQKILQEVERQVFDLMHNKLIELEKQDLGAEKKQIATPSSTFDDVHVSRDEILNEIEKEEPEIVINTNTPVSTSAQSTPMSSPDMSTGGVREPFSLTFKKEEQVPEIRQPVAHETIDDSVDLGLTQSTVAKSPDLPPPPPPVAKSYVVDPYREPIE